MRLTDHSKNPILSPCLAWFGGGSKGPSKAEKEAAAQQQRQMQEAVAKQAATQQAAQKQAAQQAAAQQAYQKEQALKLEQQRKDDIAAQDARIVEMQRQAEANKPAPGATVDPGDPQSDVAAEAAKRKGMRRSILAGESGQPITTGYSTLG